MRRPRLTREIAGTALDARVFVMLFLVALAVAHCA